MYLFDFDGTLIDSNAVWEEIDVQFLHAHGISPVPEDYTEYVSHHGFHQSAIYTKERYQLAISVEEIKACWQEMARGAYGGTLHLKEGAHDLLKRLHSQGETVYLLTSCMPELCALALDRHQLRPYFNGIFTAAELEMEKRDPEIYRRVAALCGHSPEDIIFCDDSPTYCAAAKSVGMTVIGVKDALFAPREAEMRALCHRYLQSLNDWF